MRNISLDYGGAGGSNAVVANQLHSDGEPPMFHDGSLRHPELIGEPQNTSFGGFPMSNETKLSDHSLTTSERTKPVPQDVIEDMAMLRTTGDILADELSVLRHTAGVTGNAIDALKD